jgi:MurNAc alpha-1-phosphate uridylyltransferase
MTALMIFAAGLGTRMGQLTADRPKPMIPVAGRPLIDHALAIGDAAQAAPIVVNVHWKAPLLTAHLAGRAVISDETDLLLETGGGLRRALPLLGPGPVLTLNSDAVWSGPNPLGLLKAGWDPARMDALLVVAARSALPHPPARADFALAPDGRLTRGAGDETHVYLGAQMLVTGGLAAIEGPVFSLNLLWNRIAADGRLFGTEYPGKWCDVGRPEGIAQAEALLDG